MGTQNREGGAEYLALVRAPERGAWGWSALVYRWPEGEAIRVEGFSYHRQAERLLEGVLEGRKRGSVSIHILEGPVRGRLHTNPFYVQEQLPWYPAK